ncbi:hypothetical protein PFICI_08041 [Pestalotiopsis fici W106-1]|uniref:Uncharacterized protein n=1 Tax=Pestalotiopsis fici (strain W106-1 / CGMCC3.15140) TaxID=1229662 RepID=W3X519_PESFW|nr:uncharacterized protein PFICI_08041 [Pestalotiopsis fici W106-1]ETS80512.1 hypothetical protein PFICI_08041 [Pestalotiopsis fici W106-1]
MGLWRRKHSGSSGESSNSDTSGTVTPVGSSQEPELNSKRSVRVMRSLTNGLRSNKPKKASITNNYQEMTPLERRINRPFTQQNLEHQRMFDDFTFDFGKRKSSYGGRSIISGISPCASRTASIDSNYAPHSHHQHHGDRRETHAHYRNSLVEDVPWEVSGEESDKDRPSMPPADAFSNLSLHHRNFH